MSDQAHLAADRGAVCRPAFARIAAEERCQLYFPQPGDQLVLLRTGLLVHLRKYMQARAHASSKITPGQ